MNYYISDNSGGKSTNHHMIEGYTDDGENAITYCGKTFPRGWQYEGYYNPCSDCAGAMDLKIARLKRKLKEVDKMKSKLDMLNYYRRMMDHIVNGQRKGYNDNERLEESQGSYPFIPMNMERALNTFSELSGKLLRIKEFAPTKRARGLRFLDAGCGCGNIILAAKATLSPLEAHGIEYFDKTADKADTLLGIAGGRSGSLHVFRDDILKFDSYKKYDIIYYYCPFSDPRLQTRFEERLEDEMKVGAIMVCFLKKSKAVSKDKRFKRIKLKAAGGYEDSCWIKVKGGKRKVSDTDKYGKFSRNGDGYSANDKERAEKYGIACED